MCGCVGVWGTVCGSVGVGGGGGVGVWVGVGVGLGMGVDVFFCVFFFDFLIS